MNTNFTSKELLELLEDRKKVAIKFAKYIVNHRLSFQPASKLDFIGLDMKYYSAEELWNKFLEDYEE